MWLNTAASNEGPTISPGASIAAATSVKPMPKRASRTSEVTFADAGPPDESVARRFSSGAATSRVLSCTVALVARRWKRSKSPLVLLTLVQTCN
jgi:hypothetical protein